MAEKYHAIQWFLRELPTLKEKGLVDDLTEQNLREHYTARLSNRKGLQSYFILMMGIIGAMMLAGGAILAIAYNWDMYSKLTRILISAIPLAAGFAVKDEDVVPGEGAGNLVVMQLHAAQVGQEEDALLCAGVVRPPGVGVGLICVVLVVADGHQACAGPLVVNELRQRVESVINVGFCVTGAAADRPFRVGGIAVRQAQGRLRHKAHAELLANKTFYEVPAAELCKYAYAGAGEDSAYP